MRILQAVLLQLMCAAVRVTGSRYQVSGHQNEKQVSTITGEFCLCTIIVMLFMRDMLDFTAYSTEVSIRY